VAFQRVEYLDRAVWLPDQKTLVVADLHLGRAQESRVDFPLGEADEITARLRSLLDSMSPDRVVIAGDLVHAFDSIPHFVAKAVESIQETVTSAGARLVVTEGNHDRSLERVDSIETVSSVRIGPETLVHHGHEVPSAGSELHIIGHEHPAITIEGLRRPCFLECDNQRDGESVLVLPAFSRAAVGTTVNDMTAADSMSPLLTDLDQCRPVLVTEGEPLSFPPLAELRSHL